MIEQGLVTRVRFDPVIAPLIGGSAQLRFYRNKSEQANAQTSAGSFPRAIYTCVSKPRCMILNGRSGLPHPRISVDCQGQVPGDAKTLADAFRRLDGERGQWGTFFVYGCRLVDDRDAFIPPSEYDQVGVDVVSLDFVIWFQEPLPSGAAA
jgi:hypothetical protein